MELLRGRGLRMTPQRRAIVAAVLHAQGHISPTAITRKIQSEMPGVNASTVYRTLTLLEEVGVLNTRIWRAEPNTTAPRKRSTSISPAGTCGEDDPLSLKEADALQELIRRHHGFEADLTHFAITGLCGTAPLQLSGTSLRRSPEAPSLSREERASR